MLSISYRISNKISESQIGSNTNCSIYNYTIQSVWINAGKHALTKLLWTKMKKKRSWHFVSYSVQKMFCHTSYFSQSQQLDFRTKFSRDNHENESGRWPFSCFDCSLLQKSCFEWLFYCLCIRRKIISPLFLHHRDIHDRSNYLCDCRRNCNWMERRKAFNNN